MKKCLLPLLLCALLLTGCAQSGFTGSRVKNPDAYLLTFTQMNGEDAHTLTAHAGDALLVDFDVTAGRVDVTVTQGSETLYRGNALKTGTFEVGIPADGGCTVTLQADRAAGNLSFTVLSKEEKP